MRETRCFFHGFRLMQRISTNLSETSISYTNGDKHQITATITYDYAKLEEMSEVTT